MQDYLVIFRTALFLGVTALACAHPVRAVGAQVDTELLMLIDVSGSISDADFTSMMGSYSRAFSSKAVVDSIQSGQRGKIAASVLFWSSDSRQSVGVGWMEISDMQTSRQFSALMEAAVRPFKGSTAIASAIDFAVPRFGTETGGAENGFSSVTQIIQVAGDGIDNASNPRGRDRSANVRSASARALASGVDMINGLVLNNPSGDLERYYAAHVIGGSAGATRAFVRNSPDFGAFEETLRATFVSGIDAGAYESLVASVPEPSSLLTLASALPLLLFRKRPRTPSPANL